MLLGIGTDNALYTRASLRDSPWLLVPDSTAVIAVAPLPNGSVVGVGTDNNLYTRASLTASWVAVAGHGTLLDVTALPDGTFLGVGMDNTLFTSPTVDGYWTPVANSGGMLRVTVVPEDGTFLGVGVDQALWTCQSLGTHWKSVPNSGGVLDVAVLPDGTLLGVTTANTLAVRAGLSGTWQAVPNSGSVIAAMALPGLTLLAAGVDQLLHTRASLTSAWNPVPDSGTIVGITGLPDGGLLGIGTQHDLYTRANLTDSWSSVPGSARLLQVIVLADGSYLGIGLDNFLYTAATLESGWVQVPNSGSVLSVAQLPDATFLGVGTDNGLWTRATLDSPWVQIPNSGTVSSIAVDPRDGSILGVGTDQSVWQRTSPTDVWKPIAGGTVVAMAWWNSSWGGASLTQQDIADAVKRYGPIVRFHPDEAYDMCSIEWFLQRVSLHDSVTGVDISHPTPDQLPSGEAQAGRYWLISDPGDSCKTGDLSTAKGYVHAYTAENLPYTDLQFWLFYGYNGPGTAHVNGLMMDTIIHSGDPTMSPLGEHFGDWECCVLRIDNDSKQLIGVYLTQHSGGQYFNQSQLSAFQRVGDQVVVYASKNGHALYPTAEANYTHYIKLPPSGMPAGIEFELRNDTADGGKSLDCSTSWQLVAADEIAGFQDATWVDYSYRWGPEGAVTHMDPDTIAAVLEAAFGPYLSTLFSMSLLVELAELITPSFVTDDLNGPSSPRTQSTWRGEY